jgi:ubiquinone/menaquinone biosynthesis C-methylase UbiE
MTLSLVAVGVSLLIATWIAWRLVSRKEVLPCPASIGWLVEMENPIARVTRSERVVAQLAVRPGATVADIGCGPGRVTIPLARAVGPDGEVIALDLQPEMLAKVAAKADRNRLSNIRLVQGDAHEQLPDASLDAAVAVMALGEMPRPQEVFTRLQSALRTDGRLLVAESVFDPHFVSRKKATEYARRAGFHEKEWVGTVWAYSIVFEKRAAGPLPSSASGGAATR